jgi:hypothetical protein
MSTPSSCTAHRSRPRYAALALLAPVTAAAMVVGASPASAIPMEGEPTQTQCLRLVRLPDVGPAGSPLFISHGYALVLSSDC